MLVFAVFDSCNPEENIEKLELYALESMAESRCEELNKRDYPDSTEATRDEDGGWQYETLELK